MKDWRGTDIVIGCTIVYPGRHSSSLWMTEGVVRDITTAKPSWGGGERPPVLVVMPTTQPYPQVGWKPRKVRITSIDRVTVVASPEQHPAEIIDAYASSVATTQRYHGEVHIGTNAYHTITDAVRAAFIAGRRSCVPTIRGLMRALPAVER